ncbi:MAG: hypothetical protein WC661_15120 [Opitutaceae bacterium]|jgi:phenylacetic acid degradation operon negative regulatory protein
MKASTEEFIYFIMWGAETLMRPTRSNLTGSFEQWAFRSGLGRRLHILQREKLLDQSPDAKGTSLDERVFRLTESGRVVALGGVDPAAAWDRSWDGRWRLVIFDLPEAQNKQRVKLRRTLKDLRFGYLQNSVWISPDPLTPHAGKLAGAHIDVETLTLFEGRPSGGESDQDLVRGAWSFSIVQQRYDAWSKVAAQAPRLRSGGESEWKLVRQWATRERTAWASVTACDPFLPSALLPAGYVGRKCWSQRVELLGNLIADLSETP